MGRQHRVVLVMLMNIPQVTLLSSTRFRASSSITRVPRMFVFVTVGISGRKTLITQLRTTLLTLPPFPGVVGVVVRFVPKAFSPSSLLHILTILPLTIIRYRGLSETIFTILVAPPRVVVLVPEALVRAKCRWAE